MKILVTIANYGTKNQIYLRRLLEEYSNMSHNVQPVVLSDTPKQFGDSVEVIVHKPHGDPWSFPFVHKKLFADRIDDYDLFIYSEDDTLVTQRNVDAFINATDILPEDEIAGFLRSERDSDGSLYFSTAHAHYHWDPRSIVSHGGEIFAYFTNHHSACYILTQAQLYKAIRSGGFLVPLHQEKYDLLVTAATDPYTQCGMKKMICVSRIEDFVLPHLPNAYVHKLGTAEAEFRRQIDALISINRHERVCSVLLNGQTRVPFARWSKSYCEPPNRDVLSLIPSSAKSVLSYGCGSGATEAELAKRGMRVTVIPVDSVIGASAEAQGFDVVYGDSESVLAKLSGARFDCILLCNVLHLLPDPEALLSKLSGLLSLHGSVIALVPNLSQVTTRWRRAMGAPALRNAGIYTQTGTQMTSYRIVRSWFTHSGLKIRNMLPRIPKRAAWLYRACGNILAGGLAEEFSILAERT